MLAVQTSTCHPSLNPAGDVNAATLLGLEQVVVRKGRSPIKDTQVDAGPSAATVDDRVYWTTKEVATYFRTAPSTVRYWKMIGYGIPAIKIGRNTLYLASDVRAFEAELKAQAHGA